MKMSSLTLTLCPQKSGFEELQPRVRSTNRAIVYWGNVRYLFLFNIFSIFSQYVPDIFKIFSICFQYIFNILGKCQISLPFHRTGNGFTFTSSAGDDSCMIPTSAFEQFNFKAGLRFNSNLMVF